MRTKLCFYENANVNLILTFGIVDNSHNCGLEFVLFLPS